MNYFLDEKSEQLIELQIDEASASKADVWQYGETLPGTPSDLAAFLSKSRSKPILIFVQDRVLCDATRKKSSQELVLKYKAYRIALFAPTLIRITPLANQERSYKPMDEPNSFSVCTYGLSPVSEVMMDPPVDRLDLELSNSWSVCRLEIDAKRRLDCWYYQVRFITLRIKRETWNAPTFNDIFIASEERAQRSPLLERPNNGALRWISSAQINETLHAISPSRIRGGYGQAGRDTPLIPGDFLVSMLGFTEVKLARYNGPPDDATRSMYLLRFSQRQVRTDREAAELWFSLTCPDFLDQLRMELSDRVMKPLTEHFFQNHIRVPKLPSGVTPGMAYALDVITRLALEDLGEIDSNLGKVKEALSAEDVTWPGKWSCLRRISRYLNPSDKAGTVVVLSNDPIVGKECVSSLRKGDIRVADPRLFSILGKGLAPEIAKELAKASTVVSITSAVTPLQLTSEQLGAAHALDISGKSHVFGLYAEKGQTQDFPARQFLEHLFSETEQEPASIDVNNETMTTLTQHVLSLVENPPVVTCDDVIDRLSQLDSPLEPFSCFSAVSATTSILDRVRPDLARLSSRLMTSGLTKAASSAYINTRRKSRQPHTFGKFVTYDETLAERVKELKSVYQRALELTRKGSYRVIALLVEGETGCGKDELIDYLDTQHATSSPLIRFGVAADPRFILSQLFGHARGSFTGSAKERDGIFGLAKNKKYPVFLNEINSYPLDLQFRLLTVIERGEFSRLGEDEITQKYSGVVLTASNKPIVDLVAGDTFRLDLQMRLGSPFVIPPLRERRDDIECIFDRISHNLAKDGLTTKVSLELSSRNRLMEYSWPGNARELQGLILRACLLGKSVIDDRFLEDNFPNIYFGDSREVKVPKSNCEGLVPQELKCLEEIFKIPASRKVQYAELMKRLKNKVVKTNELSDWVRSRQEIIEPFKTELPLVYSYLKSLVEKRPRQ